MPHKLRDHLHTRAKKRQHTENNRQVLLDFIVPYIVKSVFPNLSGFAAHFDPKLKYLVAPPQGVVAPQFDVVTWLGITALRTLEAKIV